MTKSNTKAINNDGCGLLADKFRGIVAEMIDSRLSSEILFDVLQAVDLTQSGRKEAEAQQ